VPETRKRLTTILALDVAGYSRATERDDAAAAGGVHALRIAIAEVITPLGGRVFNTAGDGFMLEFPSAASGVQAAMALLTASKSGEKALPRVRIGLHLGDVFVEENGDLLGHGVNVAARLQALADPGSAIVSETVRAQVRSATAVPFVAQGRVHLDKMNERLAIFSLTPGQAAPLLGRIAQRRVLRAFVVIAILTGAVVATWYLLRSPRIEPDRIAVAAFETLGAGSLDHVAAGIGNAIVNAMAVSDLQIERVPPGSQDGGRHAAFLVEGAVQEEQGTVLADLRITDGSTRLAIWSSQYRRAAGEAGAMPEQVAAHVTEVLRCALTSHRSQWESIAGDLPIFLRACDRAKNPGTDKESAYEAARRVTVAAPDFSRGWSLFAIASAEAARAEPASRAQKIRGESASAATRALELDPSNAEAYLAGLRLLPRRNAFREQRRLIDQALAVEPNSADVLAALGAFEVSVGRLQEGIANYKRAVALEPLSAEIWAAMIPGLAAGGYVPEAKLLRDRLARVWPNSVAAWWNRLNSALYWAEPEDGLRMLENAERGPIPSLIETREAWRPFLLARQSGDATALRAAARHIADLAQQRRFHPTQAITAAYFSGEREIGYALAVRYFNEDLSGSAVEWIFFWPSKALRSDPRFMSLAYKAGLVTYWQETGLWPDFCRREPIPYDCRRQAAALTARTKTHK
jgi:adenylate cyclase